MLFEVPTNYPSSFIWLFLKSFYSRYTQKSIDYYQDCSIMTYGIIEYIRLGFEWKNLTKLKRLFLMVLVECLKYRILSFKFQHQNPSAWLCWVCRIMPGYSLSSGAYLSGRDFVHERHCWLSPVQCCVFTCFWGFLWDFRVSSIILLAV